MDYKNNICLLDCTLRDGGYVNNWNFGHSVISGMYKRLDKSGVDFIEAGFLDDRHTFNKDRTITPDTKSLNKIYDNITSVNAVPVAMIDFGTCDINNISQANESFVKGIRVIFKKDKIDAALPFCKAIKDKGYMLFIQAISITDYSDEDMLEYVKKINGIMPFAFSIVDTYGLLDSEKLEHYFNIIDENLDSRIAMGYHSHNNFQLAFSNTIKFLNMYNGKRKLIADSTVYGMGKSAGNCATELLAMHMNDNYGKNYDLNMILEIIDTYLMTIYMKQYWGYKYNFYISAMQNCHPNYVQYLLSKKTLSVKSINELLNAIPEEKKLRYDEAYISNAYTVFQTHKIDDAVTYNKLSALCKKNILVLGPGKSIVDRKEKIQQYIDEKNPIVISINFLPDGYKAQYVFISNSKRYSQFTDSQDNRKNNIKLMATSNIEIVDYPVDYYFNYESLLLKEFACCDNALILFLNALSRLGVKNAALAGFDGYAMHRENYYSGEHNYTFEDNSEFNSTNKNISNALSFISKKLHLNFITDTLYKIEESYEI